MLGFACVGVLTSNEIFQLPCVSIFVTPKRSDQDSQKKKEDCDALVARSKQIKSEIEIDNATQKFKEISSLRDTELGHIGNIIVGPSKDCDGNLVYGTTAVPISNDEMWLQTPDFKTVLMQALYCFIFDHIHYVVPCFDSTSSTCRRKIWKWYAILLIKSMERR